jgi:hypothetical protein
MKRLVLIIAILFCTGCATNVGRALSSAFRGTPEEVVAAVQFVDQKMGRELREKYDAVESSDVTNPDGSINHTAAENRFRDMADYNAEIEKWEELSQGLADYLGVSLDEPSDASEKRADKRRRELWSGLLKGAKEVIEGLEE